MHEPLWALLDIYGNCISIELVDDPQQRTPSLQDQSRNFNSTLSTRYYDEVRHDILPLPFLPVHSPSISFFQSSSNALPNASMVLYDNSKTNDGLIFFSEPLTCNSALLIHILNIIPSNESRLRPTTAAASNLSNCSHIQLGLTNCNTKALLRTNELPIDLEQINKRSEFWIIQDFQSSQKATIDRDDEFLFTLTEDGIIAYSQNNSKLKDFIHVDSSLIYYPFLIFKGDIVAIRSIGYVKNLDRYRSFQQMKYKSDSKNSNQDSLTTANNEMKNESTTKLQQDCTICLDRLRDTVLIPCGHICLCYSCAKEVQDHGTRQCKNRRGKIKQWFFLRLFQVQSVDQGLH